MELKLRVGQGVTGWVARTGKPARVGDVRQDARYVMLHREVRSELAVPLEVMGEVRGVLNVDSQTHGRLQPERPGIVGGIGGAGGQSHSQHLAL